MRYIGEKSLILNHINNVISKYTTKVKTVLDIFAGSGIVSTNFKNQKHSVISNDMLYFSYILNKASIGLNSKPNLKKLKQEMAINNPLEYLNCKL